MQRQTRTFRWCLILFALSLLATVTGRAAIADDADTFFEKHVRPLLIERCHKCHAGAEPKAGLRLDTRDGLIRGGETGTAVVPGKPQESLLLKAVLQQDGLKMPPNGKLSPKQIEVLETWIRDGAVWSATAANNTETADDTTPPVLPMSPDHGDAGKSLQLWLRADVLRLDDGEPVVVWPDQSAFGRDVSATRGIREGGVGQPGTLVRQSTLMGRPAVRFSTSTGFASSPGNPVDIRGDAALTMTIVMNLAQPKEPAAFATVLCVGDPANGGDPGKPLAALIEIDQTQKYSLDFAGGWGHDASPGPASFSPYFAKPIILTIIKQPGSMKESTRFYINGELVGPKPGMPLVGRETIPDIRHRKDLGVFLGKALGFCGAIQGDLGEVLIYNSALSDASRSGIEAYLGEKYGLWIDPIRNIAAPARYTDEERSHWAYQPVKDPPLPEVKDGGWIKTPIDRFTLAKLESQSQTPPAQTDRRTYIRRVTLDLTGLPPTPEEVAAYLEDRSAQADERLVDRLLNSPHYGERWARHWLDIVRYAESTANDANAIMRYAWRYRNYVIDALNNDLPYDQFLVEQLAGDLLPPTDSPAINTRRVIAAGYLMIGPKALAETDKEQSRLDIVDDQIDVTGRAMLGLTLACARCHDHKFDAIRAVDYYAIAGIFRSTEPFQDEVRNASMWWEYPVPQGPGADPIVVMAPKEAQPRNLRVHLRGNRFTLGKIVPRGALGVISQRGSSGENTSTAIVDPHQTSSGRLEFARWIASPANPLTARVLVNRVWQHHFGQGIVATSDNFGTRGAIPSQPELLDWLAARFIENGWSLKQLHRMIVLSNTYRAINLDTELATRQGNLGREVDALPQVRRRRLSAEEVRDAMLAVSGQLDRIPGTSESGEYLNEKAEGIGAKIRPNRVGADDEFYTTYRKRSVYLPIVRNILPDVLSLFDAADPNGVTTLRNETTVALQGLFLLNHPFVREQAKGFATSLLGRTELTDEQRIGWAHQRAFGRDATADEVADSISFLTSYEMSATPASPDGVDKRLSAWQALCQALFCSNEFLYVE